MDFYLLTTAYFFSHFQLKADLLNRYCYFYFTDERIEIQYLGKFLKVI